MINKFQKKQNTQSNNNFLNNEFLNHENYENNDTLKLKSLQKKANSSEVVSKTKTIQKNADNFVNPNKSTKQKANSSGIPDHLKSGMEKISGMSLDHVKVHYNSNKPASLNANAYAQGSEIHLGKGQEKHLPHELGHVVQQAQGKVKPTTKVDGMPVNDNQGLEKEADNMGNKAMQLKSKTKKKSKKNTSKKHKKTKKKSYK